MDGPQLEYLGNKLDRIADLQEQTLAMQSKILKELSLRLPPAPLKAEPESRR